MSSSKSRVSFNIPGKTFLLGEYVALFGGPSLVAATAPSFVVTFISGSGQHPFHAESPAGRYIARHKDFFAKFDITFVDPYQTGGFGASTAQFIAVCGFQKKHDDIVLERPFNFKNPVLAMDIWNSYRELFVGEATPPSGADLIAQIVGGVTSFRADKREWEKIEWPWTTIGPLLCKTPYKVNTHEHLSVVDKSRIPVAELQNCVELAVAALKKEDFNAFKEQSLKFLVCQEQAGLLAPDAHEAIAKASKTPGVLLARGCGALGADVLAVYGKPQEELKNLKMVATIPDHLAYGLIMEVH
jgi:mevalonate kinase